jgi:hypothetical protein
MTLAAPGSAKKNKRKFLLPLILDHLGIDRKEAEKAAPLIFAPFLLETAQDVIREMQTEQIVTLAPDTKLKDWVIEDDAACDFCKDAAAASPYNVNDEGPITHPNCRCYWVPHVD